MSVGFRCFTVYYHASWVLVVVGCLEICVAYSSLSCVWCWSLIVGVRGICCALYVSWVYDFVGLVVFDWFCCAFSLSVCRVA